jgi:hypothetical protein
MIALAVTSRWLGDASGPGRNAAVLITSPGRTHRGQIATASQTLYFTWFGTGNGHQHGGDQNDHKSHKLSHIESPRRHHCTLKMRS